MKNILYPQKTVVYKNAQNVEALKIKKSMQIDLAEPHLTTISEDGYIVLDFGKEICGNLRLLAHVGDGDRKVRIVYGESVSETLSELGEKGATNDHATRDFEAYIPDYSDMTFFNSGFRFVKIQTVGNSSVSIKNAVVTTTVYDKPAKGKFICDDKEINKIFKVASYTLRLCLQNGMIWDGIKRDRLVWIGDMNPETLTVNSTFGSLPHVENSLNFAREQTPLPGWMNGFPTYSLWWIISVRDYYFQNKNDGFLLAQKEYMLRLVKQISDNVTKDGKTTYDFNFIDWPTHYLEGDPDLDKKADEITGTHALTVYAVKCAKELYKILGEDEGLLDDILSRLLKAKYEVKKYKQVAGLKIVAGIGDRRDAELIIDGGAKGMSTFMSYFILKGATAYGYYDESIKMLKDYYGAMLSLGATSFWEDFDISWAENAYGIDKKPQRGKKDVHGDYGAFCYTGHRHSLCHGWSSGVVPFLMQEIAGVKIVDAGCGRIRISPNLGSLNFVKVCYPTPYGVLEVEHTKTSDGQVVTKTKVPDGVTIIK